MPTEIKYGDFKAKNPTNGSLIQPHYGHTHLIGYAKESPKQVLAIVTPDYLVANYQGLVRPVVLPDIVRDGSSGLIISEPEELDPGLSVTGRLEDLDLSVARADWGDSIDLQRIHKDALRYIIRANFGGRYDPDRHGADSPSLDEAFRNVAFDAMMRCRSDDYALDYYGRLQKLLLEVAQATLRLRKPSIERLEKKLGLAA